MAGRVVHVKKDPFDVWVARGSKWGNPFRIGDPHPVTGEPLERGEAIPLYKEWIVRGEGRHLLRQLGELEDKVLGCFCAAKGGVSEHDPLMCHGQILLKLLAWRGEKIRKKRRRRGEQEAA